MRTIIVALMALGLTACGGGSSADNDPPPSSTTPPQDVRVPATGIWKGIDNMTGLALVAMIDGTGDLVAVRADGAVYYTTSALSSNGSSISGAVQGVAPFGSTYPDGSTYGSGSLSGTVIPMNSITGTVHFTTANDEETTSGVSLTYQTLYDAVPSIPSLVGTYTDSAGDSAHINTDGTFTAISSSGCQSTGNWHAIQANKSLYQINLTYQTCSGTGGPVSGITFEGFAMFDPTTNSAVVGLHDTAGVNYGLAFMLTKH